MGWSTMTGRLSRAGLRFTDKIKRNPEGLDKMQTVNLDDVILRIKQTRSEYEAVLAQIDPSRLEELGAEGGYSVKDVIAHIAWHEAEMVGLFRQKRLAGSPWWNLSTDERNALIWKANHDRPLSETLQEAQAVYRQLLDVLETVSEDELNDPRSIQDMPPDWLPWVILAQNTYEHYEHHTKAL